MLYLILFGIFLTNIISFVLSKLCSNILAGRGSVGKAVYTLVTGLVACFFFWMFTGFTLEIDLNSIILGAVYSVFCIMSSLTVTVYKYAEIATVNVTKNAMSLIISSMVGFVLFSEEVTYIKLLRIGLMLASIMFVFFDAREDFGKTDKEAEKNIGRKRNFVIFALIMLFLIPVNAYSAIQSVLVANYNVVTDMNTYFFMTNVFMVLFAIIWLAVLYLKDREEVIQCTRLIGARNIFAMSLMTFTANVAAVLGVLVLKYIDVSVSSPLNSAFAFIGATLVSLFFREKIGKYIFISVLFAIAAVTFEPILNALI